MRFLEYTLSQSSLVQSGSGMPDAPRKPTVKDVAKKVGLSHTAVSLALRGRPGVSLKQQQRIRKAAAELGYQPKAAAQMLRSGRSGYLGMLLEPGGPEAIVQSSGSNALLNYFLYACQERQRRYNVEFFHTPEETGFEPPHILSGSLVDGILLGGFVDAQLRHWLSDQKHYPWVSVDEPGPYSVLSDIHIGVADTVKQLYDLGHRRIAYGGGPYHFLQHENGRQGYLTGMAQLGLPVDEQWIGQFGSPQPGNAKHQRQWVHQLLKQPNHPTAYICNGMGVARNTLVEALTQGLNVPRDISVIAVGMSQSAMDTCPAFSTIENNYRALLNAAMDMLVQLVEGQTVDNVEVHIPPVIVMRDSVGPAPLKSD
ncbi:MAG TPA: hypothetical protein DCM28_09655 [Phycisphaerales bacterium]|nr:hypothetical protein [Phycisphaerales bacterium]